MASSSMAQLIMDNCISCGACVRACSYLSTYVGIPKRAAKIFLEGDHAADPQIPFLCNLCGLCEKVCSFDLNPGAMMLEAREHIVESGIPLPGYVAQIAGNYAESAQGGDLRFSPAPSGTTKRLFFPGCNLVWNHAESTIACAQALQLRDPDCGILLGCCGAPLADSGDALVYQRMVARVKEIMADCGAAELLLACTNCARHFTDGSDIPIRDVYGILAQDWGSFEGEEGSPALPLDDLVLHDPCKSRFFPEVQEAVRTLLQKRGYGFSEPAQNGSRTHCCGQGGMVAYTDYQWADSLGKQRADEIQGTLVTYCATCRNTLCQWGLEGAHLLDLLFLDADACRERLKAPAAKDGERLANREKVRGALVPQPQE